MITLSDLPALNALLNSIALILLLLGYSAIRRRDVRRHQRFMVAAFMVSVFFLMSYVTYRIWGSEKRFSGIGWVRPVYFFILITHVTLAATVPFLAARTLYLAWRGRWAAHRRLARWTFPIWVYVSVTGVIVYLLLFILYGPLPPAQYRPGAPGSGKVWPVSARRDSWFKFFFHHEGHEGRRKEGKKEEILGCREDGAARVRALSADHAAKRNTLFSIFIFSSSCPSCPSW